MSSEEGFQSSSESYQEKAKAAGIKKTTDLQFLLILTLVENELRDDRGLRGKPR